MRRLGSKSKELKGGWKRLHNEELYDLCTLTSIIKGAQVEGDEMGWACRMHVTNEKCTCNLVGKPEGKRPRRITRRRW
jgi:hypothetical protein